jgi:ATP-dependent exoDNAse (exonuclease V) alpha subunit
MNAAIPERRPATEEISGVIERVTFHNDESGFCVLRVKARGQREETTVVGSLPSVTAGEWLSAEGWWVRDKEHGLQFKATTMKTVPPTTAEGIERYLGSGLVKGIGPILAKLEEIDGEPLIFLPHLRRAEEGIAARIKSLAEAEPIYPPIDFEKVVAWCEGTDTENSRPQPARGAKDRALEPCGGHHRGTGRGKNHAREFDSDDPASQAREVLALRPNWAGGEAANRNHGHGSEDDSSPA